MGGNMKNVLLWVGITALALQDYFKKQPVKTKEQAFIEGTTSFWRKILKLYKKNVVVDDDGYEYLTIPYSIAKQLWNLELIEVYVFYGSSEAVMETKGDWEYLKDKDVDFGVQDLNYLLKIVFNKLYSLEDKEEFLKLAQIASNDWELAYEIAKGQNLL